MSILRALNGSVYKTEKFDDVASSKLDAECLSFSDWTDARICNICIVSRGNKARVVVFF